MGDEGAREELAGEAEAGTGAGITRAFSGAARIFMSRAEVMCIGYV